MRPMLLTLLLLASLPTFPQAADSTQLEGTIGGTVLDEHGEPFKGVKVCTYMTGAPSGSKEARGDCPVTTDEAGQFRIDHVAMGTFGAEAIKLEDGYVAFAGTSVREMVTITPSQSSATVVLRLGPKPGVLLPSVKDKLTGEPIISFQVSWEISDSDSPNTKLLRWADNHTRDQARHSSTRKISSSDNLRPRLQEMDLPTIRLILLGRRSFVCNRVKRRNCS